MTPDKTGLHLRILAIESFLALGLAVIVPLVAGLEGEEQGMWTFALFFAGVIGITAHSAVSSLHKRISELENQPRVPDGREVPAGSSEPSGQAE